MSLSREEIETLRNHLEDSRKKGSGKRDSNLDPVTSESLALVVQCRGTNDPVYHAYSNGQPACGIGPDKTWRSMDIEVAEAWRKPCHWCYPEEGEQ